MKNKIAKKYIPEYIDIVDRLKAQGWTISKFGNASKPPLHLIFKHHVVRLENHVPFEPHPIKYRITSFTYTELKNFLIIYKNIPQAFKITV